jgi:hypothetical protein
MSCVARAVSALDEIFVALDRRGVDYIVVGGLAAVLQGAPVHTDDLDVVYARDPANLERLQSALEDMGAVFRTDPARRIRPNLSHLESDGHKLLKTRHGVLDLLATVEEATDYAALLPDAETFEVAGVEVRVLSLERLAEIKRKLDRPKDKLMLAVIEATLAERKPQS